MRGEFAKEPGVYPGGGGVYPGVAGRSAPVGAGAGRGDTSSRNYGIKSYRRHTRHHPEDPEQAEVTLAWYPEGKPG